MGSALCETHDRSPEHTHSANGHMSRGEEMGFAAKSDKCPISPLYPSCQLPELQRIAKCIGEACLSRRLAQRGRVEHGLVLLNPAALDSEKRSDPDCADRSRKLGIIAHRRPIPFQQQLGYLGAP